MSSRRKPNSHRRKDELVLPPGARANRADRGQIQTFARELVGLGVPPGNVRQSLHTMLTTDIPRQCACGALHRDASTLAYFQQAHTNTVVLWAKCPECAEIEKSGSQEANIEADTMHSGRVQAWASGELEPEGVVFIFTFGRPLGRQRRSL